MTVSRVINGSPKVTPDPRARVEAAIAELRYRAEHAGARVVAGIGAGRSAWWCPILGDPFFTLVLRGRSRWRGPAGYRVIVCNTNSDGELEASYVDDLIAHQVDGMFHGAGRSIGSKRVIDWMAARGLPHVLIDRSIPGSRPISCRAIAWAERGCWWITWFRSGHRRIGHITEPQDVSTARDRFQGYREALEANGIAYDPALVAEGSRRDDRGSAGRDRRAARPRGGALGHSGGEQSGGGGGGAGVAGGRVGGAGGYCGGLFRRYRAGGVSLPVPDGIGATGDRLWVDRDPTVCSTASEGTAPENGSR